MTRSPIPDLLPGTLDLLILRTLQTDSLHGWAISERIQQISQDVLQINQGSLYPALHRLEHQGWIEAEWAVSELGRRASTTSSRRPATASWRLRRASVGAYGHGHRPRDEAGMTLRDLLLRIRALVSAHRVEHELDEELAFHIERETHKHIANGLSPADARARALARFGSVPLAADQCRDARGIGLVEDLTRDIVYAIRAFRRAPLAAVTIIATVALGLGLVTAVFTIYNTILFRADAVRNPGELFVVEPRLPLSGERVPLTRADYEAMRRDQRLHRCRRTAELRRCGDRVAHRQTPRGRGPGQRELLPNAWRSISTRPTAGAGRRCEVRWASRDRAQSRGLA